MIDTKRCTTIYNLWVRENNFTLGDVTMSYDARLNKKQRFGYMVIKNLAIC